jgi:two-component system nitrate/nitrite response regulator NarL
LRLLLADDHHLVREALSFYLRHTAENVEIDEAASLDEALTVGARGQFDAIILDLKMPGMNGLAGVEAMRERHPDVPVVILTGNISRSEALEARRRGISVISKELRGPALIKALRLVIAGETFVSSNLVEEGAAEEAAAAGEGDRRAALGNLTRRELEAVRHLAEGRSNREIATAMGLAEVTVKLHLHNAFHKMGARSRADAVRIALQRGLGTEPAR